MTKVEAEIEVRAIARTCKGPYTDEEFAKGVGELLKANLPRAAERLSQAGRKGCGYDFNNVIMAYPLDGEEHTYTCPNCKVTGTYRAPVFEITG